MENILIWIFGLGQPGFAFTGAILRNSEPAPDAKDWVHIGEHRFTLKE